MEERLLSINELSMYLNIPKSTLYKLSQKSEIPVCKIGKQLRYRKSSIDKWLSEKESYKTGMPEIVITAFADTAIEEEARSIGVTDYIYKPFATTDFIQTVEKKLVVY